MKAVKAFLPKDSIVTVPTFYHFDSEAHVLIMEDCGGDDTIVLTDFILGNPNSNPLAKAVGSAIGTFLGQFHTWGSNPEASQHDYFVTNKQVKMAVTMAVYGKLIHNLTSDEFPELANPRIDLSLSQLDIINKIATERSKEIINSHETLIMGDFRPGNIIVRFRPGGDRESAASLERIYIHDWETINPSQAGIDVGHFTCSMKILHYLHPKGDPSIFAVLNAFLESYRKERGEDVDEEFARLAVVHAGTAMIGWAPWSKHRSCVRPVAEDGVEMLVNGYEAPREWLQSSVVGPLL